ncbi:ABC transporter permease [Chloroflexi bacterium TSY]|nr:ABC transporter permease [Chloroflexi bacterium TSY]
MKIPAQFQLLEVAEKPRTPIVRREKTFLAGRTLNPRWRKVLRDLSYNKTRSLLVILAICVGVFSVGMITSSGIILDREMTARYMDVNPASAELTLSDFGDDFLNTVRRIEGVGEAAARQFVTVRVRTGPDEWESLELIALSDYEEMHIDQLTPESGTWPPPDHTVVIERAAMELIEAEVDDTLLIETSDNRQRELRVAGTVHDITLFPANLDGTAYGFVTFDTLARLGIPRQYNELHLTVAEERFNEEHIETVVDEVREKAEKSGRQVFFTWIPTPGQHPVFDIVESVLFVLTALGMISLVVSAFLVYNTISAILIQQTQQIGIMKAVGANGRQLAGMYICLVVLFGLTGAIIAIPLAIVGASAMTTYVAGLLNFDLESMRIPPSVLLLEIGIGLIVPLAAAWWPIRKGVQITVREAMNSHAAGADQVRVGFLERFLQRAHLLSRPFLISFRNTFRRKGRFWLSLFTLALGGAIAIAVFSVRSSVHRTLDDAAQYWNYDIAVFFDRNYRPAQVEQIALTVPGVVHAESWLTAEGHRLRPDGDDGVEMSIVAPPADTKLLRPILLDGRWLHPDDGRAVVVNSQLLDEEPDLDIGSELTLKLGTRETQWLVVGTVRSVLEGPVVFANSPYFARAIREVNRGWFKIRFTLLIYRQKSI